MYVGPTPTSNWIIPSFLLVGAVPTEADLLVLLGKSNVSVFVNLVTNDEARCELKRNNDWYFDKVVRLLRNVYKMEILKERSEQLKKELERENLHKDSIKNAGKKKGKGSEK